jgi:tripeptidyl-peptidase-1
MSIIGRMTRESGTSASAPVFAAMVTLWNDMRFAYGKPPMGFVAPFLYSAYATSPAAFQDITTGNNVCRTFI